jgi:hypothetical protein
MAHLENQLVGIHLGVDGRRLSATQSENMCSVRSCPSVALRKHGAKVVVEVQRTCSRHARMRTVRSHCTACGRHTSWPDGSTRGARKRLSNGQLQQFVVFVCAHFACAVSLCRGMRGVLPRSVLPLRMGLLIDRVSLSSC